MGLIKLFPLLFFVNFSVVFFVHVMKSVQSTVVIHFDQTPQPKSSHSYADFLYSFQKLDGSNACQNNDCLIHCQLDGQELNPCPDKFLTLKNLSVNHYHEFILNVTTSNGETNSSSFSWFIDTIQPTATISSEQNYTNAERIAIEIKFSEACLGRYGGFKCVNSSDCDVIIKGSAYINPDSLRVIKPDEHYELDVILSSNSSVGRVIITMANGICTDQAGNQFTRTNTSSLTIHIDRRPVLVDFWTSVPSFELVIDGVPRTVLATNKIEDMKIFLDFNVPVMNSTKDVLNALRVNKGSLVPIGSRNQANHRFAFQLNITSRTEIITVELQSHLVIGRTGAPVSPVPPITFLYDVMKPGVRLSTNSPNVTKASEINFVVEFSKPVFGFKASTVNVTGGRITRLKELSRALYSMNVEAVTGNMVSITIPEGRLNDISGNLNMVSNQLEVRHYSTPSLSVVLHSFMTVGVLATSLANAFVSLSYGNLGAMETLASGTTNMIASDPSMNLQGMIGHLQVFVLSDWISVNQPVEFSETTKGLRWLIPHQTLPWKNDSTSVWPDHIYLMEEKLYGRFRPSSIIIAHNETDTCLSSICGTRSEDKIHKNGWFYGPGNMSISMKKAPFGLALDTKEYFVYFLRGEPMSANDVVKRMDHYKGWQELEMNLFWLGIGGGGLVTIHILLLVVLKWRTRTPINGILSVPRFEIFLLILMLPCIAQSSTFVIRGGTTTGIIAGALLLAIPAAFILSIFLFLVIAIFAGSFVQYKEVEFLASEETWCAKLWWFFTSKPVEGKWFYREGLPSSFLSRFGILFEGRKGPPIFVFIDQNDTNTTQRWGESSRYGLGRERAISSVDSHEKAEIRPFTRLLGCVRSSYIVIDLLRRVSLGIITGAFSSKKSTSLDMFALSITSLQFAYLFSTKPYISRGVHIAESVSLLCEIAFFGLSIRATSTNPMRVQKLGFVMLALLFITFASHIINEWYALMISVLRLSHPQKGSLKQGLKIAVKGLVFPFLSRKHWPEAKTTVPLIPEKELKTRDRKAKGIDPINAMSSTIVPMLSPGSPAPDSLQLTGSIVAERYVGSQRSAEGRHLKRNEKKLKAMALASFPGDSNVKETNSRYAYRP